MLSSRTRKQIRSRIFGTHQPRIRRAKEPAMSRNYSNHSRLRWLNVSSGFALCFATVVLLLLSRAHAAPQQASVAGTSAASESRGVPGIAASPAFSAQDLVAPPPQNWLKV